MKNAFNFLLIFLFCFTLASCGGGDDTVDPTPDPIDNTGGDDGSEEEEDNNEDDGEEEEEDNNEDDDTTEDPNPQDGAISPIPETFTQKVVIEEATGTWCGWCPMGIVIMDKYMTEYPNRVYGVAVHSGDEMENTTIINVLDRVYDLSGYPSGLVNRRVSPSTRETFMHPAYWSEVIDELLEKTTTSVGIALETNINEADAIATVQAHVGFGKDVNTSTDYKILIYLIEDGIVSPQENYLSGNEDYEGTEFNEYYEAPAVVDEQVHNNVAKRPFTSLDGEAIDAENVGEFKKFKKEFQINLTRNDNLTESYVVAVLLQDGSRPSVLNVQKVKLGETKDWD